ncbi:MiaB/RimO family radical SAM methylthiotransferase [Candidatus Vampirococcus lugosii]|uniref:tRNA-2-methylthio-N(6)-dimethylallyladenosine synthase n=1 Tax=Candidatus Vampirococcus lugosii TaxID=2789015 RepID=A0ABS5QKH8_9BACT|nr:MiaB/RimO family radical SAM methylthiotransferase [Candidatus Vampirococcus lugosii]MBS8121741.1 tRNA-i(6)A37 methylthiotransferase [Candidatus Vampirococcus lugosii]
MKFHIIVYGCQMNYSDSARIRAVLINCGFNYVENIDEADLVIIDTCSVRQKSEDKVFGRLKEIPKDKKIWITGCMIQHNLNLNKFNKFEETVNNMFNLGNFQGNLQTKEPVIAGLQEKSLDDIIYKFNKQNPNIENGLKKNILLLNNAFNPLYKKIKSTFNNLELIFRIDDLGYIPVILKKLGYSIDENNIKDITNEYTGIIPNGANQLLDYNSKVAYIPIQTGCSQFCAYCIVPYARGLEKNRKFEDIINEVNYHINNGVQEIVLVGQIVNKHPDFNKIIKEILKIKSLKWLRYTSPYPTYYNDELFDLHENEEKLCPHIHIPVQSGSNSILKKMFRGYTVEQFKEFINKIHSLGRDISITTDIIIGFCGETQEDFQKSLELVKYSKFDMIFMGIYSTRPGTIGAKRYIDDISPKVKSERWDQMNEELKKISNENNQKEIGKVYDVMITNISNSAIAYNEQMKNIIIDKNLDKLKIGEFYKVKIVKGASFNLYAELI